MSNGGYKSGVVKIEIQSLFPEKFVNLLWKNDIYIRNIIKLNVTTMVMEVNLRQYKTVEEVAQKTKTKIKIVGRKGINFYIYKIKRQISLVGGVLIFIAALFYLSTFIWSIDIITDRYLSPYEIRQKLYSYGIRPGIAKNKINVKQLEERIIKDNGDIMWLKARIEGSRLKITLAERTEPPTIISDDSPANIIAKTDGEIVRIFTTAGTASVKAGDIVTKGQLLIKGEQGKEGSVYPIHAKGEVTAKTFYEYEREVPVKGIKKERTGNKIENRYFEVFGKKIYIKKSLNKFTNYDRIEEGHGFITNEEYYETKTMQFSLDTEKVVEAAVNEYYTRTIEQLDKSVKLIDKIVDKVEDGNNVKIRVVLVIEQQIGLEQKVN